MKRKSGHVEPPRKKRGQQQHGEDIRDFEVEDSGDDEWLEEDVVPEDEEGEWEDFDRLKLTEDEAGQVKLTVNPEFMQRDEPSSPKNVWKGDRRRLKPGEELEFDSDAYKLFHRASVEWSCLSIDVFREPGGTDFPYTIQVVTGSQAGDGQHKVYVMKWADLTSMQGGDDSEDSDDNPDEELEPKLEHVSFSHRGAVNRVRLWEDANKVATWSESGTVQIFDIAGQLHQLQGGAKAARTELACFNLREEGYALEWGYDGRLYAGGNGLFIFDPSESGWTQSAALIGHTAAVEDIQRSPSEPFALASCGCDRSIKFWDTRAIGLDAQLSLPYAHNGDVNVIAWNSLSSFQVASGGDDSVFKVWDLRNLSEAVSVQWHSDSITSIAWNPKDESELSVSSADDRVTVWDFMIEDDCETEEGFPSQLLFVHQGQEDLKELRYHPTLGFIVSTGADGFNVFRPAIDAE
jgi:ribosome assembly protein RRB1